MPAKIVLVTGGARSGKSEFAEKYVLHYGAKCAYIATAEILDEEMAERVRLHKARRPRTRWINFEAPYNAHEVLCEAAQEADAVLFDCLTLYMSNLLYGKNAPQVIYCTAKTHRRAQRKKKHRLLRQKLPN